jgi:hypothetical protein
VLSLPDLIAKLTEPDRSRPWIDVPALFNTVRQEKFSEIPAIPPGTWTGKMKLEALNGLQKLVEKDGFLCLVDAKDPAAEVVFTVLDADIRSKDRSRPTLDRVSFHAQVGFAIGNTDTDPVVCR